MGKIGIIGGSAIHNMETMDIVESKKVSTPFGLPSGEIIIGKMDEKDIVFLARHGKGHTLLPTEVNFRANVYALKLVGVDRIISVSAVGSLKEKFKPLDVLLVDQFVDRTNQARPATFFGEGIAAHISFAEPVCSALREVILQANRGLGVTMHNGGTYLNMEGPAFSTKAESHLYRSWGMDVIGMTNMTEARLAREAGMCYATMAMITDYDCWHTGHGSVSVEMIIETLNKNEETAKKMLSNAIRKMPEERTCECSEALRNAIFTDKNVFPPETVKKLEPIIKDFM